MKTTQPSTEKQSLHSLQEEKQDHQGGLQSSMSSSFAGASIHPSNSHGFASIESPNAKNANAIQQMANESPVVQKAAQLKSIIQKKGQEGTSSNDSSTTSSSKSNHTGLPNALKTGVENLSGISMDDVKVHYNSHKPKEMNAHAYAQGNQIHLGSGQEKHLPHETWHVVQQKQGRVKPTIQLKSGTYVNDNDGLENEATTMGERAKNVKVKSSSLQTISSSTDSIAQRIWKDNGKVKNEEEKVYEWIPIEDGLQWYLQKGTNKMWYEIKEAKGYESNDYIQENQGEAKQRTLAGWLADSEQWKARVIADEKVEIGDFQSNLKTITQEQFGQLGTQDITQNIKAAKNTINYECNNFAQKLSEKAKDLDLDHAYITFKMDVIGNESPSMYLDEKGHNFDQTEVGVNEHHVILMNIANVPHIIDNHHPNGVPVGEYVQHLKFKLYKNDRSSLKSIDLTKVQVKKKDKFGNDTAAGNYSNFLKKGLNADEKGGASKKPASKSRFDRSKINPNFGKSKQQDDTDK